MKIKPGRTYLAKNGAIISFSEDAIIDDGFICSLNGDTYEQSTGNYYKYDEPSEYDLIKEIKVTYEEVEDDEEEVLKRKILNIIDTLFSLSALKFVPFNEKEAYIVQLIKTVREHDDES